MNYITTLDGTDSEHHRSSIIIHRDHWYFAEFDTIDQLDFFAKTLGFTYELVEESPWWRNTKRTYRRYSMSHEINDDNLFWSLSELPEGAKPIEALSNGSIVTCYYYNDGKTITFYRPNPNAKEVYKSLNICDRIAHRRIYGLY